MIVLFRSGGGGRRCRGGLAGMGGWREATTNGGSYCSCPPRHLLGLISAGEALAPETTKTRTKPKVPRTSMARRSLGFVFRRDGGERILGDEGAGCVQTEFMQTIRLRPVGYRAARPQGVLPGLFLPVFLARMAPTECRKAPPPRRKRGPRGLSAVPARRDSSTRARLLE